MSDAPQSTVENDHVVTQWQTIITTQMHFNDMILRVRAIGSSVVLAAYGAAAISLGQYPNAYITILNEFIHISVVVLFFALSLLLSIFLMDFTYYYKLLIGIVEIWEKFEKDNPILVDVTNQLSQKVSRWQARIVVIVFYFIPAAIGCFSLWYVLTRYPQIIHT